MSAHCDNCGKRDEVHCRDCALEQLALYGWTMQRPTKPGLYAIVEDDECSGDNAAVYRFKIHNGKLGFFIGMHGIAFISVDELDDCLWYLRLPDSPVRR